MHEVRHFGCSYCLSSCFTVAYQLAFYCIWQVCLFKKALKDIFEIPVGKKMKSTNNNKRIVPTQRASLPSPEATQCCYLLKGLEKELTILCRSNPTSLGTWLILLGTVCLVWATHLLSFNLRLKKHTPTRATLHYMYMQNYCALFVLIP